MILFEIAGGRGARIHRAVVDGLRVGQHHDHLLRALCEGALDGLRHVDLVGPLLGANRVAVQRVDHRVAARVLFGIAGRQKDNRVAVDGFALQIALKSSTVNPDVLHRHRLCARDHRRYDGLHLRQQSSEQRRLPIANAATFDIRPVIFQRSFLCNLVTALDTNKC